MQAYDRFVRKRRLENGPTAFQGDWKPRDVLKCRLRSCQQSPDEPRRLGNLSDMQVLVDFENFRKSQATWEDLREVANISGLKPQCKRYICHLACIVLLQYVAQMKQRRYHPKSASNIVTSLADQNDLRVLTNQTPAQ